jgi:tripartite-type tricarboxylate transporter receptor subunit TctC
MKAQRFVCIAALLSALVASGLSLAQAQNWPIKPVRIVTGWSPGGNADAISRLLAEDFGKRTSEPIVVDN